MRMIAALALTMWVQTAHATEAGIDAGWVVAVGEPIDRVAALDALGVRVVRINFRLDAWTSPDDATPRGSQGLTWFAAYDRAIDALIARGFTIYGLINDEAVGSNQPHGSPAWIADYVTTATQIIDHFKDRVRVFELINEPNDWAGGVEARFAPRAFAQLLQDTYLAVKRDHGGDQCWNVDLVSGALFSFDDNPGDDYLAQVYAIGRNELAWDYTREVTGSFPLDAVGYHLYVAQGSDSPVADVGTAMQANLAALRAVIAQHDEPKPFYVSEWGFRTDYVGEDGQADRMAAGFEAMAGAGDVAAGLYFSLQDFPDNPWGVYDDAMTPRPSAARLAEIASVLGPPRAAALLEVTGEPIVAGGLGEVTVTLENRGTEPWSGEIRLGAAAGCPDATAINAIAWEPESGFANSITDARVELDRVVAPGETVTLAIPVRAANEPGDYVFAARMVHEGVAWFGPTATRSINVIPAELDATDPGACTCSTGGGAGLALGLLVLGLRQRRRS